jgi:hypothetical protein
LGGRDWEYCGLRLAQAKSSVDFLINSVHEKDTNRITVQAGLGIKQDPISKITNTEGAG